MQSINNDLTTKYLNLGGPIYGDCTLINEGIDTGFIVLSVISNTIIARAIFFATADNFPKGDQLTVTFARFKLDIDLQ